jgi:hypothetical protein
MALRVADHLVEAPSCIGVSKEAAQPPIPKREVIVDDDAQIGTIAFWRDLEAQTVSTDDEQSWLHRCLPIFAKRRLAGGHHLVEFEADSQDRPLKANMGAEGSAPSFVRTDAHSSSGHHRRRSVHVAAQAFWIIEE